MFDLKDKVFFVTGALNGIGFEFMKLLSKCNVKGVAAIDIQLNENLKELQKLFSEETFIYVETDISDKSQIQNAYEETINKFNQLDVVLNNAGIFNELEYEKMFKINMIGTFSSTMLALETYLPKYKLGQDAIIANVASIVGLKPKVEMPAYSITKQSVVAIGRTLGSAINYEEFGVKIITICPGHVKTLLYNSIRYRMPIRYEKKINFDIPREDIIQSPEYVAQEYLNIIKQGENGSVWVIKDKKPAFETTFEDNIHGGL